MAQVDLINEEAAAELMMSGGQGGGGGGSDKLLEYILQNATLVATCQHTTDYSVKCYCGIINLQDPNINLFTNQFYEEYKSEPFTYYEKGYLSNNVSKEGYGVVSVSSILDLTEMYIPYVANMLYKNNNPLFGNLQIGEINVFKPTMYGVPIYNKHILTGESDERIEKVVTVISEKRIPKSFPYIGDYNITFKHKIKTNSSGFTSIDSTNLYIYDSNGNETVTHKIAKAVYDRIYYNVERPQYDESHFDMMAIPVLSEFSRHETTAEIGASIHMDIPTPDIMGDLSFSDLSDIYFDYENQKYAEATPSGYTPSCVKSEIIYPPSV